MQHSKTAAQNQDSYASHKGQTVSLPLDFSFSLPIFIQTHTFSMASLPDTKYKYP